MSYAVVTTKIDPQTKKEAQDTAGRLGIPLSIIIKAFLKQFVKTKSVNFSVYGYEEPSEYLIKTLKQAQKNRKEGKGSPIFNNAEDAITYLEKQGI